jgi:DNA-binding NarL/FixJ family response regulator
MPKRVLNVGQCDPDHGAIHRMLTKHFDVEVVRTKLPEDTLAELYASKFDLVLINRKLDEDYSDGTEILKQIKADAAISSVPVMIVTNYPEHQQAAVSHGAVHGFGKLELQHAATAERLRPILG